MNLIFDGERFASPLQKVAALIRDEPPLIQSRRDGIPDPLAAIIHRMLAKVAHTRFATPQDVADALQPYCAGADLTRLLASPALSKPFDKSRTLEPETQSNQANGYTDRPTFKLTLKSEIRKNRQRLLPLAIGVSVIAVLVAIIVHFQPTDPDIQRVASGDDHSNKIPRPKSVKADAPLPTASANIGWPTDAPAFAVAPFDADTAKQHQHAWANYLGLPIEKEAELPGGAKIDFVLIPPGEFLMGSSEEQKQRFLADGLAKNETWVSQYVPWESPQHLVWLTRPFYIGKFEVTQAQWVSVMNSNPSRHQGDLSRPVEQTSWNNIQEFLAKVNAGRIDADAFSLPTEAQWEYACRAGSHSIYYWGDDESSFSEFAWSNQNSSEISHPVGELRPNAFGLYDMIGGVWEWCDDFWGRDFYSNSPRIDPRGPATARSRIHRGGSYADPQSNCRAAYRDGSAPDIIHAHKGFRVTLSIKIAK